MGRERSEAVRVVRAGVEEGALEGVVKGVEGVKGGDSWTVGSCREEGGVASSVRRGKSGSS